MFLVFIYEMVYKLLKRWGVCVILCKVSIAFFIRNRFFAQGQTVLHRRIDVIPASDKLSKTFKSRC